MMEVTELLGTLRGAGMFLKSSPDLQSLGAKPRKSLQLIEEQHRKTNQHSRSQLGIISISQVGLPQMHVCGLEEARGPKKNQRRPQGEHRLEQNKQTLHRKASGLQGIQTRNLLAVLVQSGPINQINH